MPHLHRLRHDHGPALLTFERANRAFFAASIPDRGDAYFSEFDARHREILSEQDAGLHRFHVIVDDGSVIGRVNLVDITDGTAELGYRIAEHVAGRGIATSAVRQVCALARDDYGLTTIEARTTVDNIASQKVLERTGFTVTGDIDISGQPGIRYRLDLGPASG
ncbi:GNAT family N-acetyltransferase [Stackebrandtia soli]|uniref:GNAT family N-acetyltransferase n=1 Tax=Stackebrandtia soli TaxID=1892856 RepID=UPI0039EC7C9C